MVRFIRSVIRRDSASCRTLMRSRINSSSSRFRVSRLFSSFQ